MTQTLHRSPSGADLPLGAADLAAMVDDRVGEGFFRVNRRSLVDDRVYEAEQQAIFDRCWLYVGHESELPQRGDYLARTVAGRPLIFWRGNDDVVRVYLNTCRHRGAMLCRVPSGNARGLSCFYHAWTYASTGELTGLPDAQGYGPDFDRSRFSLIRPPRVASYRGFVFCCFDAEAVELADYLGNATEYLDLVADQSPVMEIVGGMHEYSMDANWKLFVENSLDGYHLLPLHRTYFDYLKEAEGSYLDPRKETKAEDLGGGHAVITVEGPWARPVARWTPAMGEENRSHIEERRSELESRFDRDRARRIAETDRNLLIFPNLVINDIMGIVIRTITPTSAGRTVVAQWTMATKGEPESIRQRRLDSYITFQGPGGLATPDDMEACESCQLGYQSAAEVPWSDISRGIHKEGTGESFVASDEIQQRAFWRHWRLADVGSPEPFGVAMRIGRTETEQQRSVSDRLVCILDAVAAHRGEIGLTELAASTGIAKPTVHRLATDLVKHRMLLRGKSGYDLGFHLFELGQQVPTSRRLRDVALPLMSDLLEATHEIVQLAVLDGHDVVYVEKLTGRHSIKAPSVVGSRLPAYCSGLGKAILAFSDESTLQPVLDAPMPALTTATITSPERLLRELDTIRQHGVAFDRGEGAAGIVCVGRRSSARRTGRRRDLDHRTRQAAAGGAIRSGGAHGGAGHQPHLQYPRS